MNPDYALKTAAILLILTAVGGIVMALWRTRRNPPPSWLAMAHGFLAASALTLLLFVGISVGLATLVWVGLVLVATSAGIGVYLNLRYHARLLGLPSTPIFVHALAALTGAFIVCLAAFGASPWPR